MDQAEKIRTFISVEVGAEVLWVLRKFQRDLEELISKDAIRWVVPEQMHLTLRFLGGIGADTLAPLEAALREICASSPGFRLRAAGLGGFPSLRSPRVIWVGLQGDLPVLQILQTRIEEATRHWGQPPEARDFRPHLTLGRVRETATSQSRRIGETLQTVTVPDFGEWPVNEIRLMRSKLSPKGAQHSVLASIPLS